MAPELGREDIREIVFQSYRIVHQLIDDTVEIVMVHHAARPLS